MIHKDQFLTSEQRAHWEEHGYVILPNIVPQANVDAVIDAIWTFLQVDRNDPETWYDAPISKHGMLEMYQHQSLWDNRQHPDIHRAFTDIWDTEKLWVSIDRANMNPPARQPDWDYHGMFHWDVDVSQKPLPFMVQGVLFLADTDADQGGFQCAPGFHHKVADWVKAQPEGSSLRPNPDEFDIQTIPGKAGDLLIWHSLLPHGNSRNHSTQPRLAQYITMSPPPTDASVREEKRSHRIEAWQNQVTAWDKPAGDTRGFEREYFDVAVLSELGEKLLGVKEWRS
ncbi:MAG: phytanoyl-CoA dioxygenase family protein [Chloroflexota bacterium]